MRSLLVGLGILASGILIGIYKGDLTTGFNYLGGIGIVLLLIAGVLSGAFISGDRIRANIATTSIEDSAKNRKWAFGFMICGLPSFLAAVIYYWFFK